MAINYQDPRFQRALLNLQATKGRAGVTDTAGLTSQFAAQQQGVHNAFTRMGIDREIQEARLGLAHQGLAWDAKMFKRKMQAQEDELKFGLIGGLGTSIFAGLEGRRRRKETEKLMTYLKDE
jgi:hypothetical protein